MAVHPAMTFTGTAADLQYLATASFGLTTLSGSRAVAEALVASIGGKAVWIADAKRPLYHAALTVGSNYLFTLVAEASGRPVTLAVLGIPEDERTRAEAKAALADEAGADAVVINAAAATQDQLAVLVEH